MLVSIIPTTPVVLALTFKASVTILLVVVPVRPILPLPDTKVNVLVAILGELEPAKKVILPEPLALRVTLGLIPPIGDEITLLITIEPLLLVEIFIVLAVRAPVIFIPPPAPPAATDK